MAYTVTPKKITKVIYICIHTHTHREREREGTYVCACAFFYYFRLLFCYCYLFIAVVSGVLMSSGKSKRLIMHGCADAKINSCTCTWAGHCE